MTNQDNNMPENSETVLPSENRQKGKPVTLREVEDEIQKRVSFIDHEFVRGFNLIKHQPKSVTFYGSAKAAPGSDYYEKARSLAGKLAKLGYSIVAGGGQGIMEAASLGANESHGRSIGLNIKLPHEQKPNPYVTDEMTFFYFFTRKVILSFSAEAYLFFPGGFGTLDEFFEILTLVQTRKIERVPIFLVGKDYWEELQSFIDKNLNKQFKTIDPEDMDLYTISDDEDLIIETIKKVPVRNGIRLHYNYDLPAH